MINLTFEMPVRCSSGIVWWANGEVVWARNIHEGIVGTEMTKAMGRVKPSGMRTQRGEASCSGRSPENSQETKEIANLEVADFKRESKKERKGNWMESGHQIKEGRYR